MITRGLSCDRVGFGHFLNLFIYFLFIYFFFGGGGEGSDDHPDPPLATGLKPNGKKFMTAFAFLPPTCSSSHIHKTDLKYCCCKLCKIKKVSLNESYVSYRSLMIISPLKDTKPRHTNPANYILYFINNVTVPFSLVQNTKLNSNK